MEKHNQNGKTNPVALIQLYSIQSISFFLNEYQGLFPHLRASEEWIVCPSRGSRRKLSGHWGGDNVQHAKALPGKKCSQV